MPNRIIREGWIESELIDSLDAAGERFFLRLCLRADDFGRYHANPTLLKSNLFPLREDVRSTDIPRWLAACEKAGLVRCYEVSGKRYLVIPKFGQRTRAEQSKFPAPPDDGHPSDIRQTGDGHPRTESETKVGDGDGDGDDPPPPPPAADPRHHEITSRWGDLYALAFSARYAFSGRDAATLKRFLGTTKDSADDFLAIADKAWERTKADRYAKHCKRAATLCGLCDAYNDIRVELQAPNGGSQSPKRASFA